MMLLLGGGYLQYFVTVSFSYLPIFSLIFSIFDTTFLNYHSLCVKFLIKKTAVFVEAFRITEKV